MPLPSRETLAQLGGADVAPDIELVADRKYFNPPSDKEAARFE